MKRSIILILVLLILSAPCVFAENLLQNGEFNEGEGDFPTAWSLDSYRKGDATKFSIVDIKGNKALCINSISKNHAYALQTVHVTPNNTYKLSADVKVEDIPQGAFGAVLGVYTYNMYSDPISNKTDEFQKVQIFLHPLGDKMTIMLSLGGYGLDQTGKAYFDNVVLEDVTSTIQKGEKVLSVPTPAGSNNKKNVDSKWYVIIVIFLLATTVSFLYVYSKKK